jgi:hypothetical protein
MKKISELLKGVVLFIAATAFIGGGIYLFKGKMEFFTHSIQAEGIVIDVDSHRNRGTTYYYPVISFQAVDGQTYTFSSETGTSAALDFNNGDKLTVRYLEETPQMVKMDSFIELWGLPLALLIVGIVLLLVGGGIIYKYFNKIKLRKEF